MSLPFVTKPDGVNPRPKTEVIPKARRRIFSAKYKLRILDEADRCNKSGEIGALLRREGLFSSNLSAWRRQRDQGQIGALSQKKRGPKPDPNADLIRENKRLLKKNQRLEQKLEQAELIIEVQKKVSALLGLSLPNERP